MGGGAKDGAQAEPRDDRRRGRAVGEDAKREEIEIDVQGGETKDRVGYFPTVQGQDRGPRE